MNKIIFLKKPISVLTITMLLLVVFINVVFATASERPGKCTVVKSAIANELPSPEFEVVILPNGVTIRGSSHVASGASFQGIEWAVDLQNCTYQAKRLTTSKEYSLPVESVVNDEYFNDVYNESVKRESEAGKVYASAGNYLAGVKIVTKDPPGLWLASTTNKLYWSTFSNGTVQWYRSVKGCKGYTTSLNTHWYTTACQWLNEKPYYSASKKNVNSRIKGSYNNYDFLDPQKGTYAVQYSKITGYNNGSWTHSWSVTHSGEFYWLLTGVVVPDYP